MSRKAARVRDYMTAHLVAFKPGMDVLDAIHELVLQGIAGAPVVDEHGDLIGMLSEFDCMKVALNAGYYSDRGGPVADFMSTEVQTVDAEMSIIDLAQKFLESGFRRFPVMKDHRLVGQISRRDVLRALQHISRN
jgi:CBS domain-containing protein